MSAAFSCAAPKPCPPSCVVAATLASITPGFVAAPRPQCIIAGPFAAGDSLNVPLAPRVPVRVVAVVRSAPVAISVQVNRRGAARIAASSTPCCALTADTTLRFPASVISPTETYTAIAIDVVACGPVCTDCCKVITGVAVQPTSALVNGYVVTAAGDVTDAVLTNTPYAVLSGPAIPAMGIAPPVLPLLPSVLQAVAVTAPGSGLTPVVFHGGSATALAVDTPISVTVLDTYLNVDSLLLGLVYRAVWADSPIDIPLGELTLRGVSETDNPSTGCALNTLVLSVDDVAMSAYVVQASPTLVPPLQAGTLVFTNPTNLFALVSTFGVTPNAFVPWTVNIQPQ